jgi:methylated-DNA-protein-cysteine methyltransferase-like protein
VSKTYERIYAAVKKVPKGRVATYGQIARVAGLPGHARQVGYALNALPRDLNLAWHRVINAKGEISARAMSYYEKIQRDLLEKEGIVFSSEGRVSLKKFQWASK